MRNIDVRDAWTTHIQSKVCRVRMDKSTAGWSGGRMPWAAQIKSDVYCVRMDYTIPDELIAAPASTEV